jgi:type II secretory pathway component PulM
MLSRLARLWQPRNPLFWMSLGFNALSSVFALAMHLPGVTPTGRGILAALALADSLAGMYLAWRLMRDPPPAAPPHP